MTYEHKSTQTRSQPQFGGRGGMEFWVQNIFGAAVYVTMHFVKW